MAEIFISYARVDRARAQVLAGALGSEGWSVWWDRDIPPGRTFDEVIEEALSAAKCVIVLWSRDSVRSEWVKAEASDAARRRILVPVLADDVMPPLEFRRIQSAALPEWESLTTNPDWRHLCRSIGTLVGRPSVGISNTAPRMVEPEVRAAGFVGNGKRSKTWGVAARVLGSFALVAVASLAWAVASRPFESASTGAARGVIDSPPDSPKPADAPGSPSAATHSAGLESLPRSVSVERSMRESVAAAVRPPRAMRQAREVSSRTHDPGSDPGNGVGLNREVVAVSARAAAPSTSLPEEAIAGRGNVPEPVVPLSRDHATESFDVAYSRGVFRESGRLTVSSDGLRYSESGGRSSVDAPCGDVRGVQLPTVIVDGEQRMVELRLRDRVLRFTTASTAVRNQLVLALSQACGTH